MIFSIFPISVMFLVWHLVLRSSLSGDADPLNLIFREAYQNNDIEQFQRILRDPQLRSTIMGDQFIKENIESLLRLIRTQVLVKLIKPYTR